MSIKNLMAEPTRAERTQAQKWCGEHWVRESNLEQRNATELFAHGLAVNRIRKEEIIANAQKAAREALYKAGRCGEGNLADMITRALEEVATDTRKEWSDEQQRVMSVFRGCWRELGDEEGELSDAIHRLRTERDALKVRLGKADNAVLDATWNGPRPASSESEETNG